jgi:hypothetical protein
LNAAVQTVGRSRSDGWSQPFRRVVGKGGKSLVTKQWRLRKSLESLEVGFFEGGEKNFEWLFYI